EDDKHRLHRRKRRKDEGPMRLSDQCAEHGYTPHSGVAHNHRPHHLPACRRAALLKQRLMSNDIFPVPRFGKDWTLFLDRDGVVNKEIVGSYITTTAEFEFCEGVPEAMQSLAEIFGTIVVVTNQRGVGRGLMTTETLRE